MPIQKLKLYSERIIIEIQLIVVYVHANDNNNNNYSMFKNRLGRTFPAPNMSAYLQTTLVADTHLSEGQFLHENNENL